MEILFNGIDASSGERLVPSMSPQQLAAVIRGDDAKLSTEKPDSATVRFLKLVWNKISQPSLGLPLGVAPEDVTQAGWGLVFHKDEDEAVKKALEPLLEHRRQRIGSDSIVKVLEYRDGEDRIHWLARHGTTSGDVIPQKVPFYLLIVGSPEKIPFQWSLGLDVEYAVGRLHFKNVSGYENYVESLIDYETSPHVPNAKEAVFFATRHDFDRATTLSADLLVKPLVEGWPAEGTLMASPPISESWGFKTRKLWGAEATKTNLTKVLQGHGKPPAYLFTASHGLGLKFPHPDQNARHGALVCQNWPGFGPVKPDQCFAGADLSPDARVQGLIGFHFACYSGGTPALDRFLHKKGQQPPKIAPAPFLAELPKRLLSHPGGGALACIGHVERAWGTSILGLGQTSQLQAFKNAIGRTMVGLPIGMALKDFNERLASFSVMLSSLLGEVFQGFDVDDDQLASVWLARNDAEGYVLIGDPAARLRVDALE